MAVVRSFHMFSICVFQSITVSPVGTNHVPRPFFILGTIPSIIPSHVLSEGNDSE